MVGSIDGIHAKEMATVRKSMRYDTAHVEQPYYFMTIFVFGLFFKSSNAVYVSRLAFLPKQFNIAIARE